MRSVGGSALNSGLAGDLRTNREQTQRLSGMLEEIFKIGSDAVGSIDDARMRPLDDRVTRRLGVALRFVRRLHGAHHEHLVAFALLARLAAEWLPARSTLLLGVSGAVWMLGWLLWATRALPRIARTRTAAGA